MRLFKRHRNSQVVTGLFPAPARSAGFRKRGSIVAIDIEGEVLRVAQASGQGASARITRLGSAAAGSSAEKQQGQVQESAALGATVRKALDHLKVRTKEAVFSLSRGQVVLRPLQVPMTADERELASIVNFQIAKDLPFRIEDAVVDFKVLRVLEAQPAAAESADAAPRQRLELLVGAVKSDAVRFYREVAKAAGLKLAGVGLRSVAAAACAARKLAGASQEGTVLICLGSEITVEVLLGEKLVFSRVAAVPFSAGDGAKNSAELLSELEIEVVRSLHSYEGMLGHNPVKRVLVAGGTGLEPAVCETVSKRLGLPGEILDPTEFLPMPRAKSDEARAAVAAMGLALSALEPGGLPLDFANPKKPAVQRNTRRIRMLAAAAAAVVALIALLGTRASLVNKRLKIKAEVQAELAEAEKKLAIYRRVKAQHKVVTGWLAEEQNWLDHLAYLSALLPGADEIYVSSFSTTPQHWIRFSAQARTGELLAELDKKLRAAGYEVKPLSITPANDKHGYNFRTTVELNIPKKMKPDPAKAKPPARPADDTKPS